MWTLNVWGPSYLGLTRSISYLLMPWRRKEPGHQQPWCWLCKMFPPKYLTHKELRNMIYINSQHDCTGILPFEKTRTCLSCIINVPATKELWQAKTNHSVKHYFYVEYSNWFFFRFSKHNHDTLKSLNFNYMKINIHEYGDGAELYSKF